MWAIKAVSLNDLIRSGADRRKGVRFVNNKSLGVWTYQDCALVLIDYQKEMFDSIRSETSVFNGRA